MHPKMRYASVASNIDPRWWKQRTAHAYLVEVDTTGDGSFNCCERYSIEDLENPSHPLGNAYMHFAVFRYVIRFVYVVLVSFSAIACLNIYRWINTMKSVYGWQSFGSIIITLIALASIVLIKKHDKPKD